ncbi:MAG: hypothetical protein ACRDRO_23515 [Pseudonocardiaceae bacterium]
MNAREHFDWSVGRALEYLDAGDPVNAMSSIIMDLAHHEGTAGILTLDLHTAMIGEYLSAGAAGVRRVITGIPSPVVPATTETPE